MSDLKYWLALNFLPDIGPVLARKLTGVFGNPENIFQASARDLRQVENIGENRAKGISGFKCWNKVEDEIEKASRNNVKLVAFNDREYPEGLKQIPDAPLVLYVRGELKGNDRYAVAIVGSRRPTSYGLRVAEKISYGIASYGITVVSGMARGIDSAAHKGALGANARTIAVLGSGPDVPYPPENSGLIEAVSSSGAVISEFPFGTKPNKENFPQRNRVISALSLGVVVVEAAVDSGSLITVGYALDYGKEVFAVPGNITSQNSKGTNMLIKSGAKLVESAEEIIDELEPQIKGILRERKSVSKKALPEMTGDEKILCDYLDCGPKHIDAIIRKTGISSSRALSILLGLELKGVVKQMEGKLFCLG